MVVAELLRLCGHGEHDDATYVDARLKTSPCGRDCLRVCEALLQARDWADAVVLAAWRQEVVQKVEETVAQVQQEPGPDPYQQDWCALACKQYCEGPARGVD
jgi:pyruvate dehydrogenase E1 component alpha subunit/2-oxoisovalerate dehydrogenase E1 component alpha subunit